MTTEQALREALIDLLRECDTPDHLGPMVAPSEGACDAARAALALPPTPVRREWRCRDHSRQVWVPYHSTPTTWKIIQHRDVPEPGPWVCYVPEDGE